MILECLVVTGLCGIALVSLYQLTAFLSMHVLVTLFMVMLITVLRILEGFQMSIRIVLTVLALAVIVTLPWCGDPVGLRLGTFGLNALLIYYLWRCTSDETRHNTDRPNDDAVCSAEAHRQDLTCEEDQ